MDISLELKVIICKYGGINSGHFVSFLWDEEDGVFHVVNDDQPIKHGSLSDFESQEDIIPYLLFFSLLLFTYWANIYGGLC